MRIPALSLSTKIAGLSGIIVLLMASLFVYLVTEVGKGSRVIAGQHHLLETQGELVDQQERLIAAQAREAFEHAALAAEQMRLTEEQARLSGTQTQSIDAQIGVLSHYWGLVEARRLFLTMRLWLADYALTWRGDSAQNAWTAARALGDRLDSLQEIPSADAQAIEAIRDEVTSYEEQLVLATAAFLESDRQLGVELLIGSRAYGDRVHAELERLTQAAERAVTRDATATLAASRDVAKTARELGDSAAAVRQAADRSSAAGAQVKRTGHEIKHSGEAVRDAGLAVIANNDRVHDVSLMLLCAVMLAAVLLTLVLTRAIVTPLRRQVSAMSAIADRREGLERRLDVPGDDEIGQLASTFNAMLDTLQESTVSRSLLDDIVQSMNETLVVVDGEGVVRNANRALLALLGVDEDTVVGRPYKHLLGDPWIQHLVIDRAVSGDVRDLETTYVTDGGREIAVSLSAAPLGRPEDSARRFVCVAQDIRARKASDEALRESESRFRNFAESASDFYWEMDAELRFSHFSKRFEDVTGMRASEFLGKTRRELGNPGLDDTGWAAHLATLEGHVPFRNFVHPRTRPGGDVIWLSMNGKPLFDDAGRFLGYRGTTTDVTELERARRKLIEAMEAAESAARAKTEFLANMSHEIRTPMNGVLGMLELLAGSRLDPEQRERVEVAARSGSALLSLLDDVLDLSKIEAGKLEIEQVDVDVGLVIEDVCELFAEGAQGKGIEIVSLVDPKFPARVQGDPTRLRQVLTNLVSNAVKFTSAGEVSVLLGEHGGRIRVEVRDTGIGIGPDALDRVFDVFTQADGSTTRRYGGTGLGLAICRQLVRRMGGDIGASSEPGAGSRFWFELPLLDVLGLPAPAPSVSLAGLEVLLVDSSYSTAASIAAHLDAFGARVMQHHEPGAARAALDAAVRAGRAPRIVFVEAGFSAPESGGLATARLEAAGIEAGAIVRLRTAAQRRGERGSLELVKPVRRSQLVKVLREALGLDAPPAPERETVARASTRAARVLLVEDNAVNRQVSSAQLARLGHSVRLAVNGLEALEALEEERFDLVLMDCQMPVLDGYEAVRRVRASRADYADVPIIALTANAMAGDAERCLDAGMSDYLAKPVKVRELDEKLAKWIGEAPEPGIVEAGDQPAPAGDAALDAAVDLGVLEELEEVLGAGFEEVLETYLEDAPAQVGGLMDAAEREDAAELARVSHVLKSSSGNLGALKLSALCGELEARGGGCDAVAEIRDEFERVRTVLGGRITV